MRIEDIKDGGFSEIRTVSLYSGTTRRDLYYASSEKGLRIHDFAEYDFKAFVDKLKFEDLTLNIEYLKPGVLESDTSYEYLSAIEKTLFPTLEPEDNGNVFEKGNYFSSIPLDTTTGGQVYLIDAEEGVDKIEFFDEADSKNPCMKMYLGPEDGMDSDSEEYYILKDEIDCRKVIYFTISNGSIGNVNLSLNSWKASCNPNRNKYKYTLRNDEYWSSLRDLKVIQEKNGFFEDCRSGIVLGRNIASTNSPILNNKLKKISDSKYYPLRKYRVGDKVKINGNTWISVKNNNLGNQPGISKDWISLDDLEGSYLRTIGFSSDPQGACNFDNDTILYYGDDKALYVKFLPKAGTRLIEDKSQYVFIGGDALKPNEFDVTLYEGGFWILTIGDGTNNLGSILETPGGTISQVVIPFEAVNTNITAYLIDPMGNTTVYDASDSTNDVTVKFLVGSTEANLSNIKIGDTLTIQVSSGNRRQLKVEKKVSGMTAILEGINDGGMNNYHYKDLLTETNDIAYYIYLSDEEFKFDITNQGGFFELNLESYVVEKGDDFELYFYVAKEFDEVGYVFDYVEVGNTKLSLLTGQTSITVDNLTLQSFPSTDLDISSFDLYDVTREERPEREVYKLTISGVTKSNTIILKAKKQ